MLTEIISNITAQNGYATFIWFVIQAIFFLIIFLLPLRLHDQKRTWNGNLRNKRNIWNMKSMN